MANLTDTILELSVASELRTQRFEADQRRRALRRLRKLERTLVSRLAAIDPSAVKRASARQNRMKKLLKDVRKRIRKQYGDMRKEFEPEYAEIVRVTAVEFNGKVNSSVSVLTESVAGKEAAARVGQVQLFDKMIDSKRARQIVRDMSVMGGPMRDWWSNQAAGTERRYINEITRGVEANESFAQLRARVTGAMRTSAREAEAMVQTSMQTIVNETRRELYEMNADIVRGVEQRSILDRRTSLICIGLDGGRWTLTGRRMMGTVQRWPGYPPHHWRCRSTMMPVFKRANEMASVRGRAFRDQFQALPQEARSAIDTQIREGITIDEYLKKRPEKELRRQLGSGRFDLWKAGKIDTTDLIDQRGRPLSLKKLRQKAGVPEPPPKKIEPPIRSDVTAPKSRTVQFRKGMKPITASKLAEVIDRNSDTRVDVAAIKTRLNKESKYFVETKTPTAGLKRWQDAEVDPGRAVISKGSIIVADDGEIIDGRHRAAAAIARGEDAISAWVPLTR